jgi:hypothetical protein
MLGELGRMSVPVSLAAPGTGPTVLAVELIGGSVSRRTRNGLKLPATGAKGERRDIWSRLLAARARGDVM